MTRLPEGRREVYPSQDDAPEAEGARLRPGLNVSVPISFGLPLVVVGIALIAAAVASGGLVFWVAGAVALAGGVLALRLGEAALARF